MNEGNQPTAKELNFGFNDLEDQVLSAIISHLDLTKRKNFKKISALFNKQVLKENPCLKKRNVSEVRQRYYELKEIKITNDKLWTKQLEKTLLRQISKGRSLSEITKSQQFLKYDFSPSFIKNQFYTCQRMKVRTLLSYFEIEKAHPINDTALQMIIKSEEIKKLEQKEIITQEEASILKSVGCQAFFLSSRLDSENNTLKLRKKQQKEKLFRKYGIEEIGRQIIEIFMKISNSLKSTKKKKNIELNSIGSQISADLINYIQEASLQPLIDFTQEDKNGMFNYAPCPDEFDELLISYQQPFL